MKAEFIKTDGTIDEIVGAGTIVFNYRLQLPAGTCEFQIVSRVWDLGCFPHQNECREHLRFGSDWPATDDGAVTLTITSKDYLGVITQVSTTWHRKNALQVDGNIIYPTSLALGLYRRKRGDGKPTFDVELELNNA